LVGGTEKIDLRLEMIFTFVEFEGGWREKGKGRGFPHMMRLF